MVLAHQCPFQCGRAGVARQTTAVPAASDSVAIRFAVVPGPASLRRSLRDGGRPAKPKPANSSTAGENRRKAVVLPDKADVIVVFSSHQLSRPRWLGNRPSRVCISVVLPEPLAPSSHQNSPRLICQWIPRSTGLPARATCRSSICSRQSAGKRLLQCFHVKIPSSRDTCRCPAWHRPMRQPGDIGAAGACKTPHGADHNTLR